MLLLWADEDAAHPLALAEDALELLPDAQLRVLPRTGLPDRLRRSGRRRARAARLLRVSYRLRAMYELQRPVSCSIGRAMEILGERWTFLILRESFYGVRRFWTSSATWGSRATSSPSRLQRLVGAGILERVLYQAEPERYEYRLTEAGKDLYPSIVTLMRWGDRHLQDEQGPPVVLRHNACGHEADPLLVCAHCHEELKPREVTPVPGTAT